jgi:hypothetical protein
LARGQRAENKRRSADNRPVAQSAERAVYTGQDGGSSPSRSTGREWGPGVSGSMPGSYPGCEGSSPSGLTGCWRRTCSRSASTLACQAGEAGSIPARCFGWNEATPSNATDPSRPCGVSASTPLCHGGRTGSTPVRGALEFQVASFEFQVGYLQFETRDLKLETEKARYANWKSDQAQTLESVGSTPTRATGSRVGRRWDAGRPVNPPHSARQVRFLTGALGFGPLVYRQDTGFSARGAGFNSPTDCSAVM